MKKFLCLVSLMSLLGACNNANPRSSNQECNNQSADSWITTKVKSSIMSDNSLSGRARFIHVETIDGVVTLSGSVPTREDSRNAEKIAKNVEGVRSVNNQLTVEK